MTEPGPTLAAVLAYLHLARRSRSLAVGHVAVKQGLKQGRCKLILMATDAGGSLKRLDTGRVPVLELSDKREIGGWLERSEVSIMGITDPHLAAGILKRLDDGESS